MTQTSLETWLSAAVSSLCELATTALACDDVTLLEPRVPVPTNVAGAMIAIVGEDDSIELVVSSTHEGCQVLGKSLMCMEPNEPDLSQADLGDSVGEISNMVAGGIKTRMSTQSAGLRLGLPMFVEGFVEPKRGCGSAAAIVAIGGTRVHVIVLQNGSPG